MNRLLLGRIQIDVHSQKEAIQAIDALIRSGKGGNVFTPNVDHVVLAETNKNFAEAYSRAALSLADGLPIVWASKILNLSLTERVAGADLLVPLLHFAWERDLSVLFLGSKLDILHDVATAIENRCPRIKVVGMMSPVVSDNPTADEVDAIMVPIQELAPDLIIVALGAPKQELFMDRARTYLPKTVMCGFGAALDFFAGRITRAPKWMQMIGLEWLYRLYKEPKRLWKRYVRDLKFPLIVFKQWSYNRRNRHWMTRERISVIAQNAKDQDDDFV